MPHKTAILTIDDSPSIHMGERIAFLDSKGIRVVWFCRGDYLEERPDFAVQAIRAGHVLGNHSYDHAYFSKLSLEQAFEQIDRTDRILESLHAKAGTPRRIKCFRFPYEAKLGSPEHHAALQAGLRQRGFVPLDVDGVVSASFLAQRATKDASWFWTYDTEDWKLAAPDSPEAKERMDSVLWRMDRDEPDADCGLNRPGTEIVVMHDHGHTAGQWSSVIDGLLAKGLRFTLPG